MKLGDNARLKKFGVVNEVELFGMIKTKKWDYILEFYNNSFIGSKLIEKEIYRCFKPID